jgi:hypothetical protein
MTSQWRLIDGKELYDMETDAGQRQDVSAAYPQVVRRLREFYQSWWEELLPTFSPDTAIYLGHPNENPARLTSHDWITSKSTPWNQHQIRKGVDDPESTGILERFRCTRTGNTKFGFADGRRNRGAAINDGMEAGDGCTGYESLSHYARAAVQAQSGVDRDCRSEGSRPILSQMLLKLSSGLISKAGKTQFSARNSTARTR